MVATNYYQPLQTVIHCAGVAIGLIAPAIEPSAILRFHF